MSHLWDTGEEVRYVKVEKNSAVRPRGTDSAK